METVVRLSHKNADVFISVKMEYEDGVDRLPERVAYGMIQDYVEGKYGFKVHTAYYYLKTHHIQYLLSNPCVAKNLTAISIQRFYRGLLVLCIQRS